MTEMAYKYTYSVVDRTLRNFLVFVLLLLAVVTVVAVMGDTVGADMMAGDSLPLLYMGEDDSREEVDVAMIVWESVEDYDVTVGIQMFLDAYAER